MLETGGGVFLFESNAILFYFYLAKGTPLLPEECFGRASCSGCSSTQILKLHGTPELRFRALLTEGGAERLELARADFCTKSPP